MELQQMRYVVAVAEESSFTRAAERCFVVQSALSHQIKALEKELGVLLFARTSRRVELTAAGAAFLPSARASLDAAARAAADAAAAAGEIRGRLSIGVIPTAGALDVPAALQGFHRAHPRVGISLTTDRSDAMEAAVVRGDLDVALLGLAANREPKGVAWRLLATDRHVAVVSRTHRLAGRASVRLADLAVPLGPGGRRPRHRDRDRRALATRISGVERLQPQPGGTGVHRAGCSARGLTWPATRATSASANPARWTGVSVSRRTARP